MPVAARTFQQFATGRGAPASLLLLLLASGNVRSCRLASDDDVVDCCRVIAPAPTYTSQTGPQQ